MTATGLEPWTTRISVVEGSISKKTNVLLNLISNEPDIDKVYLYAKDPYVAKYQLLINKRESTGECNWTLTQNHLVRKRTL